MAGTQRVGADGKPQYMMENGKLVPVYTATPEQYASEFIGIEDLMRVLGGMLPPQAQPQVQAQAPASLMTLPPATNPMAPPPEFMAGGGGTPLMPAAPTMGELNTPSTEGPWDRYLKTWSEPGYAMQYPFQRGDQNTGAGNVAAGVGNAAINLPQNMWNLYSQTVGKPAADVLGPMAGDMWNFFTKKEGDVKAENAPPANPAAGFQPGVPRGAQPQGNGTIGKIIGVESGGKATAKNPNSSAYGPGQFIKSTWMEFIKEAHPELVTAGKMGEKELLELRSDPNFAEEATSWYAGKAVDELDGSTSLPLTPTSTCTISLGQVE